MLKMATKENLAMNKSNTYQNDPMYNMPPAKAKCFYRNDTDGICAAAIAKKYYGNRISDSDFISVEPGACNDLKLPALRIYEGIILIGVSIKDKNWTDKLLSITKNIVLIHNSVSDTVGSASKIAGAYVSSKFEETLSSLAWHWFFPKLNYGADYSFGKDVYKEGAPKIVELVNDKVFEIAVNDIGIMRPHDKILAALLEQGTGSANKLLKCITNNYGKL
jgi:hypothetical protein